MNKPVATKPRRPLWAYATFGAALGILYQVFQLLTIPQFHCAAKLVASPAFTTFKSEDDGFKDYDPETTRSFAATLVETIESPELRRRARERVRALNPQLTECDVKIQAGQSKGSAIFNVVASGIDAVYVRTYLNALLDEFMAFRQALRSQSQSKFFKRLFDEFEERRAASSQSVDPVERDRLEAVYKTLFDRLAEYQTRIEDSSDVAIYERASITFSEIRDWGSSLGFGVGLGMILGAVIWHLVAIATSFRSLVAET